MNRLNASKKIAVLSLALTLLLEVPGIRVYAETFEASIPGGEIISAPRMIGDIAPAIDPDPAASPNKVFENNEGNDLSLIPALTIPQEISIELKSAAPGQLGVDVSAMDQSVRPQDDFYRFVNGTWLKNFKMPDDKVRFGVFDKLAEKSAANVKDIIDEAVAWDNPGGSTDKKIANLYKSFMDKDSIEVKGLNPLANDLNSIDAISSKNDLPAALAKAMRDGVSTPIGLSVGPDSKDTSSNLASIGQSGLGLPNRDYYFNSDETSQNIRDKYVEYLTKIFSLAREDQAAEKAQAVFALEKSLAAHQWTNVETRDPEKAYNKIAVGALPKLAPNFDWSAFLSAARFPKNESGINVAQPSYLTGFAETFQEEPLDSWKLYLKARILDAGTPFLPNAFYEAAFEFNSRTLRGQPMPLPRWKRGVSLVNNVLGELVGQLYVQKHFPESSKERMMTMVDNLRSAFAERIKNLSWMGEETKQKALEKLAKFTPKIGYPDQWRDYADLDIRQDDLIGNVRRSNGFDYETMISKLGRPVDKGEWQMTPQTVNAYYNPLMNEIVFPAAIIQGAFFNPEADDAVNYGAIGAVIGHEMSHGFDDEGSKYDGNGELKDWWSTADRSTFDARAQKLVEQFNAYEPLPGKHINGALTLGENIGDLGGASVAFDAYRKSLGGAAAAVIDGFTGEQRFFLGWAQVWRSAIREAALAMQLATDPHSPAEYRVNGVMPNIPAFYQAFGLKPGDKLFVSENDRVNIW